MFLGGNAARADGLRNRIRQGNAHYWVVVCLFVLAPPLHHPFISQWQMVFYLPWNVALSSIWYAYNLPAPDCSSAEWLTRQLISDSSNDNFSPHSFALSKAIFPRRRLDGFCWRQGILKKTIKTGLKVADAGTSHSNLFRDGTISNSRANCSSALCIVSLANGLVSINQEKLVSFSKQSSHSSIKQSCQCYSKTGM